MLRKARIMALWEAAVSSYWFVPSLMSGAAVLLSILTIYLDRKLPDAGFEGFFFTSSPSGARAILSTIAGSLISVAGVVFSITIVALTLASNQFGPRILRNFMRDKGNQTVLGTFVASFLYCLLVLRQVHGGEGEVTTFVPHISVLTAVASAIAGVGVLIFFIHHVAMSIQAPNLLARIAADLLQTVQEEYSATRTEGCKDQCPVDPPEDFDRLAIAICAERGGYIQRIDGEDLAKIACEHDLVLRMERRPGQFVATGDTIMSAYPSRNIEANARQRLLGAFNVDVQRSLSQDPEYALAQMVEVGVRALSPGINDPFTAMECADWLAEVLGEWTKRCRPAEHILDGSGRLRVSLYVTPFPNIVDAAFNQLRQNSTEKLSVTLRLLESVGRIGKRVASEPDRLCLKEHAQMLYEQGLALAGAPRDRRKLEDRYAEVARVLSPSSKECNIDAGDR